MKFDLEKAMASKVILLYGDDTKSRIAAVRVLLSALAKDEDDYDTETIVADQRPLNEWFASAGVVPFLADYRVTVVRNIGRVDIEGLWKSAKPNFASEKPKAKAKGSGTPIEAKTEPSPSAPTDSGSWLKLFASRLPETGRVVLIADAEIGDADKTAEVARRVGKWAKSLEAAGAYVAQFAGLSPEELGRHLQQRAREAGKALSPAGAALIANMVGSQTSLAEDELDKLILYICDQDSITEPDIRASVVPDTEYSIFSLVDAVMDGKSSSALSQLLTLFHKNAKVEQEAFQKVFPMLARQFRSVWQARACVEAGCNVSRPLASVLEQWPPRPNLGSEREFVQAKAFRVARRLDYPRLARCFALLAEADGKIKGIQQGFDSSETLELLILELSATCR